MLVANVGGVWFIGMNRNFKFKFKLNQTLVRKNTVEKSLDCDSNP